MHCSCNGSSYAPYLEISKLRRKLPATRFTLQTIFGRLVIYTVHFPCHGSPYKPYLEGWYLHCALFRVMVHPTNHI